MSWTLELFCRLGFAWNSRVIKLSSSLEFDGWAKVSPVRLVSATSGREVDTPLTVEPATLPVWVWRRMKVKLKMSSSSFDKRSKNVGTGADGETSGSCSVVIKGQFMDAATGAASIPSDFTWMYSMGVSSPASRFATNLTAGNAFGDRVKRRRRELLMVIDATETGDNEVSSLKTRRKEGSTYTDSDL